MTPKQTRFVEEYLIDLNATQAYIRAGYSPKDANSAASRLCANVSIRACIDKAMAERSKRTGITPDRVLRELGRVAFVDPTQLVNMAWATVKDSATEDDCAVIQSVKVKTIPTEEGNITEREVKFCDKLKALELLGRHLGMFNDKLALTGDMEINVNLVDDVGGKGAGAGGA